MGQAANFPAAFLFIMATKDAFVNIDDIEWIQAADYYACLHVGRKSFMLRETYQAAVKHAWIRSNSCASIVL